MTIYKYLPKSDYTKFDNKVITISRDKLADGAKILYMFLAHLSTGKRISHPYIRKSLGIGQSTVEKYIRQLKTYNLIEMVRVGPKQYDCYIGSTQIPAYRVKLMWKTLEAEDADNPYTTKDILDMQKKWAKEDL